MDQEQMEILYNAWALAREGFGMVITNDAYPVAHELAEQGWLERQFVDDELAWFWTPQAEVALNTGALMLSADGREN
jgi:hypothetical protein